MEELLEKVQMFKTTLETEYEYCIQHNLETEAETLEHIIFEWNEIFN